MADPPARARGAVRARGVARRAALRDGRLLQRRPRATATRRWRRSARSASRSSTCSREQPYTQVQSYLDATEPKGHHYYWRTEYLAELERRPAGDACASCSPTARSRTRSSGLLHLGGALNERAADDGAVGNRDARYVVGANGMWEPGEPQRRRVPATGSATRASGCGRSRPAASYINFQTADEGDAAHPRDLRRELRAPRRDQGRPTTRATCSARTATSAGDAARADRRRRHRRAGAGGGAGPRRRRGRGDRARRRAADRRHRPLPPRQRRARAARARRRAAGSRDPAPALLRPPRPAAVRGRRRPAVGGRRAVPGHAPRRPARAAARGGGRRARAPRADRDAHRGAGRRAQRRQRRRLRRRGRRRRDPQRRARARVRSGGAARRRPDRPALPRAAPAGGDDVVGDAGARRDVPDHADRRRAGLLLLRRGLGGGLRRSRPGAARRRGRDPHARRSRRSRSTRGCATASC